MQMKKSIVPLVVAILFCVFTLPAFAQSADEINTLKKEIETLKEGQKSMQKDIQDIKNSLRAKQAPPEFKEAVMELGENPLKGDTRAKVTLVEFSDFQ